MKRINKIGKWLSVFCISVLSINSEAQKKLFFNDFQSMVVTYHPMSLKISLKTDLANWYLTKAKGNFDPKIYAGSYQKYLNDQSQFSLMETGIKIPTRSPVTLETGMDLNNGAFLNPENKTGNNGLIYAGVSVSLLQGLLTDPSRTELRKAEIFQEMTGYEQQLLLNDLLFYSGKTYWEWFTAYHVFKAYEEARKLAFDRFDFVYQSAKLGDRPYYDTIESAVFLKNIEVLYEQSKTNYRNAVWQLSLFLWDEDTNPLMLDSTVIPPSPDELITDDSLLLKFSQMRDKIKDHPELKMIQNQSENLILERKLNLEQIKPQLNVKYNFLSESLSYSPVLSANNYTWGLHFYMPLFLRRERAELKMTDLKLKEMDYEIMYKSLLIKTEFEKNYNLWELSAGQVSQWKDIVANNKLLTEGESKLFNAGESSIFMVNTRQVNYLNAELKYFEMISKNNEFLLSTFKAAGILNGNL